MSVRSSLTTEAYFVLQECPFAASACDWNILPLAPSAHNVRKDDLCHMVSVPCDTGNTDTKISVQDMVRGGGRLTAGLLRV